jgi:PKD repeat protein
LHLKAVANGPYIGIVGHEITFDGSNSYDIDGNIIGYRWDFENDGIWTNWMTTPYTTYIYKNEYKGLLKLQVKNNNNELDIDTARVEIIDVDEDGDALLNSWEINGYDADGDGTIDVDLPSMGADFQHKDIFIEIDWMVDPGPTGHSHRPKDDAIEIVVDSFNNSPVYNPDGTTGIHLHVDYGSNSPLTWGAADTWGTLSNGNPLDHIDMLGEYVDKDYAWSGNTEGITYFDDIKAGNFSEDREPIFHYSMWIHDFNSKGSSGRARGIPSSDFMVSLGQALGNVGTTGAQAGTFMHELGHNIGLQHGGIDGINHKPNYLSIMNYAFQFNGLRINGNDGHYDYSRFVLPELDETDLDETVGLSGVAEAEDYGTYYYDEYGFLSRCDDINTVIDWNDDGEIDNSVKVNINYDFDEFDNPIYTTNMVGSDNWDEIVFDGGLIGEGSSGEELPQYTKLQCITNEEAANINIDYSISISGPGMVYHIPGYSQDYLYSITNIGELEDTYDVTISKIKNWADITSIPSTINLQSGETINYIIPVNIPLSASVGEEDILDLTLISQANPLIIGDIQTITKIIDGQPPAANANGPYFGKPFATINFNSSGSYDPDGTIEYYEWDFGDDSPASNLKNPTHQYDSSETYTVTLRVVDNHGIVNLDTTYAKITYGESPLLNLIYPTDGETLKDTITIQWTAFDSEDGDNLPIYLYLSDDGESYYPLTDNPVENTGEYSLDSTSIPDEEYKLLIETVDSDGNVGHDSVTFKIKNYEEPPENNAPDKPVRPNGENEGKIDEEYSFTTSTTDIDGDQVYYKWDWGDETSGWLGPYNSGETCKASHIWDSEGSYNIKVKAKDQYGDESPWSEPLTISMSKKKSFNHIPKIFIWLFERFPFLQQIFF